MAQDPKDSLSPAQLTAVLAKLDEVLAEAGRLRKQITRQMAEQRRRQQMKVTPARRRKKIEKK